jgi:hypothetical protein
VITFFELRIANAIVKKTEKKNWRKTANKNPIICVRKNTEAIEYNSTKSLIIFISPYLLCIRIFLQLNIYFFLKRNLKEIVK